MITRDDVAERLNAYLQGEIALETLVDWGEEAMREGEFDPQHFEPLRDAVAKLGLADVRAFGLTWEDVEQLLDQLGYEAKLEISKTR